MKYVSTRGMAPALEFGDVLLTGLAADGGLYVPESWPSFSLADFVAEHGAEDLDHLAVAVGDVPQPAPDASEGARQVPFLERRAPSWRISIRSA